MSIPAVETSYIVVGNRFTAGDPFGYINGESFVILGPSNNHAFLVDNNGIVTETNQLITELTNMEMVEQIQATFPAVTNLSFVVSSFNVGDEISISEII